MFERTLLPAFTLSWREIIRFFRNRGRVVGALGTPIVFWVLLGSGLGSSFRIASSPEGLSYLEYFYPGTLALILMFTSIFSTISTIEDRREGFLQAVLVSPISRMGIILGKVSGTIVIALIQVGLCLLLAPFVGFHLNFGVLAKLLLGSLCLSYALSCLGFAFAWRLNSVQGFHAIMNLILFPMWLLSGAVFPLTSAPLWLKALMWINPMTYGVSAIRQALYGDNNTWIQSPPFLLSLAVALIFGLLFHWLSIREVNE